MFKRRTVFVLGAGASAEAGLPVGTNLAADIRKKMDIRFEFGFQPGGTGDFDLFSNVTHGRQNEADDFQNAAWRIRDGLALAPSIDDFLDLHRANRHINFYGKAAIVKSVLEAERASKLYFSPLEDTFNPDKCADTWFVKFMYMLGRGIPKEDIREIFNNISFIVFNYDRCLEHFLLNALQRLYGIENTDAQAIVDCLTVIHPYGVVDRNTPFGFGRANYAELAAGIKTYTEQVGATEVVTQLATEIERAECIVFLGFAYHSQNVQILKPARAMPQKEIYGTAFKMSDADVEVVSNQIGNFFDPVPNTTRRDILIKLENKLKSADLFDYYARSLSGGD
jgi:hypothetical protein